MKYPRSLAVRVLVRVLSNQEPLDEVLAAMSGEVDPSFISWLNEICVGTLRWKGRLDWILDSVAMKKKPSGWLRKHLLLSTYQIVVQDRTSIAAVVSETVSEIKRKEGEAPAKFANACLRKIADHRQEWRNLALVQGSSKEQAAWASLPEWLWSLLVKQKGLSWASEYALASLERPSLWVRAKNSEWKPEWAQEGPVKNSWQASGVGAIQELSGYREGEFIVQDISSQLLISEVTQQIQKVKAGTPRDLRAWDLCAAPGGKAIGLAWNGFQVLATDRNESRLGLLKQNVSRVAPQIQVVPWQEEMMGKPDLVWPDLVWIDAPCSGTGILRRHPDVRWLRQEKELNNLVQIQSDLLKKTWERIPIGGFLVYSVCSVLEQEGPELLRSLKLEPFVVNQWSLWPQDPPGGDGFWAVLLRKTPVLS